MRTLFYVALVGLSACVTLPENHTPANTNDISDFSVSVLRRYSDRPMLAWMGVFTEENKSYVRIHSNSEALREGRDIVDNMQEYCARIEGAFHATDLPSGACIRHDGSIAYYFYKTLPRCYTEGTCKSQIFEVLIPKGEPTREFMEQIQARGY